MTTGSTLADFGVTCCPSLSPSPPPCCQRDGLAHGKLARTEPTPPRERSATRIKHAAASSHSQPGPLITASSFRRPFSTAPTATTSSFYAYHRSTTVSSYRSCSSRVPTRAQGPTTRLWILLTAARIRSRHTAWIQIHARLAESAVCGSGSPVVLKPRLSH